MTFKFQMEFQVENLVNQFKHLLVLFDYNVLLFVYAIKF